MNVVDSSGWLDYFVGGRHARTLEPVLEDIESLLVLLSKEVTQRTE